MTAEIDRAVQLFAVCLDFNVVVAVKAGESFSVFYQLYYGFQALTVMRPTHFLRGAPGV